MATKKQSGGGKQVSTRPLNGPGSEPGLSAMVGGIANRKGNPSAKKGTTSFNRGGRVK